MKLLRATWEEKYGIWNEIRMNCNKKVLAKYVTRRDIIKRKEV